MLTFKKYSEHGVRVKKDINDLPFEEIEYDYQALLAEKVQEELNNLNTAAKRLHERLVERAKALTHSEQEDDSLPELEEVSTIDPEVKENLIAECNLTVVDAFVKKYAVNMSWSWLGPQLLNYLGSYSTKDCRIVTDGVEGLISAKLFLNRNVLGKPRDLGLWRMITKVPRGRLMDKQTLPEHTLTCALVPLYMASQKKYHSIPFTHWLPEEVKFLVDADLLNAMFAEPPQLDCDVDELIKIRHIGLTYISKAKATPGQEKQYNASSYHQLSRVQDSAIGNLPKYAKVMLCQIWCAHPDNRHKLMILDPYNWDNIPDPLVSSVITKHRVENRSKIPAASTNFPDWA